MTRSDASALRPEDSRPVLPFHRVARVSLTPFNPAGESSRVRCQAHAPELSAKSDGLPMVSACVAPSRLAGVRLLTARAGMVRSEEHTSELQSLMRISYAVFCLK